MSIQELDSGLIFESPTPGPAHFEQEPLSSELNSALLLIYVKPIS